MCELIITNNPLVKEAFGEKIEILFNEDYTDIEVLTVARDKIHMGAKLIMHPMAGRIKPHETPYKSVFLEDIKGQLDMTSFTIIEDSIAETKKYHAESFVIKYYDEVLPDLQFIDLELLKGAVEEF